MMRDPQLIIGDSIVWWRVCAVWRNRPVYCLRPLLIVLIFGMSRVPICSTEDISQYTDMSLHTRVRSESADGVPECVDPCRQPQMLLQDGFFVNACAVLSLALNILATGLIGYKAWCVPCAPTAGCAIGIDFGRIYAPCIDRVHRRLLRGHFGHGRRKSRVVKALALLVESGTIYCVLLVSLVPRACPLSPAWTQCSRRSLARGPGRG